MQTSKIFQIKSRIFPALMIMMGFVAFSACYEDEADPFIRINPFEALQVDNNGAEAVISVDANIEWNVSVDDAWVKFEQTAQGINVTAEANANAMTRRTLLHIKSDKHP
ncbi:MAG: BACON domain-containing protein, partial [Tannerella sp.]|nr:BACON domain-containing protein [Tannerella sp.]